MSLFAENLYQSLLAIHALTAFVLLVSLIMGSAFLYAVSEPNWKHIRISGLVSSLSYILLTFLGWSIYPVFRINTRAAILDVHLPHITGLFEIKEHLVSLGFFVALAVLALAWRGKLARGPATRRKFFGLLYAALGIIVCFVMVFAMIIGGST